MIENNKTDVIVVGAGAAGLGVSVILSKLGLDFIVLEKDEVGASFKKWPKETKFISPSFTGNFFKMADLNAITPDTSPALSLMTEHPTGEEYASYLEGLSAYHKLPVYTGVEVKEIQKDGRLFTLDTSLGSYECKFLIWAAGEYQYPKRKSFQGSGLSTHYSEVPSFSELDGDEHIVIGAYESGFDAACNLINQGKKVILLDDSNYLEHVESDSSYCLSPFTRDRINSVIDQLDYHSQTKVESVEFIDNKYLVKTKNGKEFETSQKPINCTGFASSLKLVQDLFIFNKQGYPLLTELDEATRTKNLFLVGPQVKHDNALFCFIYKYRQRFAIVAETIAKRKRVKRKLLKTVLKDYKELNFYLDDLSCCDGECVC
ncbi:NAD(P)/FAD-dependent oxidoreductase [Reichenbachiella versicolor]|uniref:NAD(P)/FAD-dependent oxidoreductase n=1 Tax=Reichenbachiella versicolor TaxID=1821036 RepID=UPI000D6E455C|nr:NAD(P)/FAD-dependent oxidoreductase [Reichenbachiella versicolor]